jgi:hypothetical protein
MTINQKTIDAWNELKEHTDIEKISIHSRISRVTISNAFKYKRASSSTILAIDKYFKEKKSLIKNLAS